MKSRRAWRANLVGLAFVSPWVAGFLLFTAGPMLASVVLSFTSWTMLSPPVWTGGENFRRLFTDDALFLISLRNTALYVLLSIPASIAAGLGLALLLNRKLPGMGLFRTVFFLPSITNIVAVSLVWLWMFNPEFGLINSALRWLGIDGPLWLQSERWAVPSLVLMSLWGVGGSMVIFIAALQNVPRDLYEAAEIDGAGSFRRFVSITLPMISPALFFTIVMGMIGGFQVFSQAFVMTGTAQPGSEGGPNNATLFMVLYLYKKAFQDFQMGYASALAWILFFIILGLTMLQRKLSRRWVHYEGGGE